MAAADGRSHSGKLISRIHHIKAATASEQNAGSVSGSPKQPARSVAAGVNDLNLATRGARSARIAYLNRIRTLRSSLEGAAQRFQVGSPWRRVSFRRDTVRRWTLTLCGLESKRRSRSSASVAYVWRPWLENPCSRTRWASHIEAIAYGIPCRRVLLSPRSRRLLPP